MTMQHVLGLLAKPREQEAAIHAFLFANSVLAVGMVFLMGVLSATAIIWSLGLAREVR